MGGKWSDDLQRIHVMSEHIGACTVILGYPVLHGRVTVKIFQMTVGGTAGKSWLNHVLELIPDGERVEDWKNRHGSVSH